MKTEDFKDLIRPIVYKYGSGWLLDNPEMLEEICKKYHKQQLLIHSVVSSATECRHNSRQEKYNYIKWIEFAESEVAKGNKQTQCSKCKKWYFPSEM